MTGHWVGLITPPPMAYMTFPLLTEGFQNQEIKHNKSRLGLFLCIDIEAELILNELTSTDNFGCWLLLTMIVIR